MDRPVVAGFSDLELIGSGGFGSVWSANEIAFQRPVALKVLDVPAASGRRIHREALALGRLTGISNVIEPLSAAVAADGRSVLVLPLLAASLADLLQREPPMDAAEVIRWAGPLATALDLAHSRRVFHRDLKPANVLFSSSRDPYLADFGIAALEGLDSETITRMSFTPNHSAPERFGADEGDPADGDRWAFASTVSTALCGREPFGTVAERGLGGVIARICHEPPRFGPSTPETVCHVLDRALAKHPSDRFPTATDFVRALADAVTPAGVVAPLSMSAPPAPTMPIGAPPMVTTERPEPATVIRAGVAPPQPDEATRLRPSSPAAPTTILAAVTHPTPTRPSDDAEPLPASEDRRAVLLWCLQLTLLAGGTATAVTVPAMHAQVGYGSVAGILSAAVISGGLWVRAANRSGRGARWATGAAGAVLAIIAASAATYVAVHGYNSATHNDVLPDNQQSFAWAFQPSWNAAAWAFAGAVAGARVGLRGALRGFAAGLAGGALSGVALHWLLAYNMNVGQGLLAIWAGAVAGGLAVSLAVATAPPTDHT